MMERSRVRVPAEAAGVILPEVTVAGYAKRTCTLRTCLRSCVVHTERAPGRQQLHVVPAMTQQNSAVGTPLGWRLKNAL